EPRASSSARRPASSGPPAHLQLRHGGELIDHAWARLQLHGGVQLARQGLDQLHAQAVRLRPPVAVRKPDPVIADPQMQAAVTGAAQVYDDGAFLPPLEGVLEA